jgi:hypothetical protein
VSSPWQSSSRNEALEALPEIERLAKDLLTPEKYEETNQVFIVLLKPWRQRRWAIAKLCVEIGNQPTRPLIYLWPLFHSLPRGTRECIRYLGDYLDLLTKEMAFEFVGGNSRHRSLGANAFRLLKSNLPAEIKELAKVLLRYNDFLYAPGKHDFSLPPGRKHAFTPREVVLTTYVSAVIADKVKVISKAALIAVEKDNLYIIGGRWGSEKRVKYAYD